MLFRRPFSLLSAAGALLAAAACTGCFDRDVARREVAALTPEEASAARERVTLFDFHAVPGEEPLAAFPEGLGDYPALRRIYLRGQKAAAEVPPSIAEARGLVALDLSETGLKDLPAEAASLPALRTLWLADNGLSSVPAAVCGMKALTYLNLDRNALTALPEEIGGLSALKWVRLNGNRLHDLPASAAEGWKDIRRLYLRGNGLKEVPAAVLRMSSLEELDLGENDLSELPPELFRMPNLHRLELDGNPRLAALPENVGDLKSLTHLFVFRCALATNEQARVRAAFPDPVRQFIAF